jgi:hypothetical protein
MTKPRLIKVYRSGVWQCRSPEYWGCGSTPSAAYAHWIVYMERYGYL